MMEVIQLQNELNLQDVVKSTVDQYNKQMSLLTDDLISEAQKNSNTVNEYIAFMKGAAFFFRRMAKRSGNQYGTPTSINTIEGAIKHCIKLLPFMEESENQLRNMKLNSLIIKIQTITTLVDSLMIN